MMWGIVAGTIAGALGERAAGVLHIPTRARDQLGAARRPWHRCLAGGVDRCARCNSWCRCRPCRDRVAVATATATARFAAVEVELGDSRFDITHSIARDGHPQSHARLVLRPGRYFDFDDFLRKAERLVPEGADMLDVGGVKAGPGPEVERGGGARPGRAGHRGAARRASTCRCRVDTWRAAVARRRSPRERSSATTSAASPTPSTCRWRRRRARPSSRRTSDSRLASPDPEPVLRRRRRPTVVEFLRRPRRPAEAAGIPRRADHGRRRPRPRQDRGAVARAAAGLRRARRARAIRCCCRRRTSASSATCSALEVTERREATIAAHALGVALGLPRPARPRRAGRSSHGRCHGCAPRGA